MGFYFLLGSTQTGKSVCRRPMQQATPKGPRSWWRYRSCFILYLSSHHPHSSCSDNLLQSIKQALIWSYHPAKNFHFNWQGAPFITGGVAMCSLTAGERDTGKLFRRCPEPENKNAAKPLQPRPTENRRLRTRCGLLNTCKEHSCVWEHFWLFSKKKTPSEMQHLRMSKETFSTLFVFFVYFSPSSSLRKVFFYTNNSCKFCFFATTISAILRRWVCFFMKTDFEGSCLLFSNGCFAVNGCRQNESKQLIKIHK